MSRKLKILFFDVETSPLKAYVWGQRADWIPQGQLLHDSFLLSWAARWEDQRRILSEVLTPEEAIEQNDERIVASLADLLREADYVVAHNADNFDIPVVNTRLLRLGMDPLGPVRTIDTLKLARKSFRFASNKLDYIARILGVPQKLETSFELWDGCYRGDPASLAYMVKYNRHDVAVLQSVYYSLLPYVKGLPRLVESNGLVECCPYCGGENLQRRGFYRTNASTFQRWQCTDCSRWSRTRTAEPGKRTALVPVS